MQLKITSSLQMKIICDPRREELNEGDDHPSFNSFIYMIDFRIF